MTTPNVPAVQGSVVSSDVNPAAIVQPQHAALFMLGEVLKKVVHSLPAAFQNEADLLKAENAINKFVSTGLPAAVLRLLTEQHDAKAATEDVSLRKPPNMVPVTPAANVPSMGNIDYDKLAAALIAAQQRAVATVEEGQE